MPTRGKTKMIFPRVETCLRFPGKPTPCEDEIWKKIQKSYLDKRIFIDIPYLEKYIPFMTAIWTTVVCCGLDPVFACDESVSSRERVCKICALIQTCKYAITDISKKRAIPLRSNVTFELGMIASLGRHGRILIENKHNLEERISDFTIFEPIGYDFNREKLIKELLDWFKSDIKEVEDLPEDALVKLALKVVDRVIDFWFGESNPSITTIIRYLQKDLKNHFRHLKQDFLVPSHYKQNKDKEVLENLKRAVQDL